ncbi:hypothetical protein D3C81_1444160 [compost metagenome]
MQGRGAEVDLTGQVLDAQGQLVVLVEPGNGLANSVCLAVGQGNFVQPVALRPTKQTVENLPAEQRRQHRDVARGIQQADQPQQGV